MGKGKVSLAVVASAAFALAGGAWMSANAAPTATHETAKRAVSDATITARIKAALIANPQTKAHHIDVTTYRGVVQLSGFVDSKQSRTDALRIARQEPGVRKVDDALHVMQRGGGFARAAEDSETSAKVKAALIANHETKAHEIDVDTLHGEVLLSGFVDSNEERAAATKVAQGVQGVKKVDNELQVKPGPTQEEERSSSH